MVATFVHPMPGAVFGVKCAVVSALLRRLIAPTIRASPENQYRQWRRLMDTSRLSNAGLLRGIALVAALCWCSAPGADRASLAAPADELVAALTVADGEQCSIERTKERKRQARVVVRGDQCDGRRFLRKILAKLTEIDSDASAFNIDLDMKLATLTGFNGQALRDVTLRFAGRAGKLLEFRLTSKLGFADISGGLGRGRDGRRMIYLKVNDVGDFFRFTNVSQHIQQGRMRVAIDVAASRGTVTIDHFSLVGIPSLKAVNTSDPNELKLSRLRFGFHMFPRGVVIIDGILRGPTLAAAVSGKIDIANSNLNLRGILFAIYASHTGPFQPNFHWLQEGRVNLSYEVLGSLQDPVMRINPFGDPAPGLLRKLFARDWDDK
jgi:hypothetical protein